MTSLRGARILAADLSLSCSGICIFDLDSMMPTDGDAISGVQHDSIYARAWDMARSLSRFMSTDVLSADLSVEFIAIEGPATNSRFRNEETSCVRQAFYSLALDWKMPPSSMIIVPPSSAKLALTGKGNADKMAMVNAALAQTRGTPFFDTLSALVKPGRKANPEAEAISDAFGIARAAAKILFQRNAREGSLPFR